MSRIDDGLGSTDPEPPVGVAASDDNVRIWLDIPDGYFSLPLTDIADSLRRAAEVLTSEALVDQRPTVELTVNALQAFLRALAARDAVYCGIGRHASIMDGAEITSTLVVSVQDTDAAGAPRLLLAEMLERRAAQQWQGQADLLEVLGRPVLFCESVEELPAPQFPGGLELPEDATAPVFQLEALIPADDGTRLASIVFATPFVRNGPEFRTMMAGLAGSLSFEPPTETDPSVDRTDVASSSIRDALG